MFNSPVSARSRTSPYLPRNVLALCAKSASPLLLAGLFATALCVGPAFADNEDHKAGAVRLLGVLVTRLMSGDRLCHDVVRDPVAVGRRGELLLEHTNLERVT